MAKVKLEVQHLSVDYETEGRTTEALKDISFQAYEGEFISIVGPSGCGKSTLLKAICGLLPASEGKILIDGKEVSGVPDSVGFVFQNDALLPRKSVVDNIRLPLELKGMDKAAQAEEVRRLIRMVNLTGFEKYPVNQLSGGMRKRVALARTFAYDPDIYLMDEPFGPLDAQTRMNIGEEFLRIWENLGKSVLFVTHDIEEAITLSDRILLLSAHPGRLRDEIVVDLDRPRPYYSARFEPRFTRLQKTIWENLSLQEGF